MNNLKGPNRNLQWIDGLMIDGWMEIESDEGREERRKGCRELISTLGLKGAEWLQVMVTNRGNA